MCLWSRSEKWKERKREDHSTTAVTVNDLKSAKLSCVFWSNRFANHRNSGENTHTYTHTYTLSHRQLVWPLRLTVPIAELFLFNWESARRVVHCNDNDGALLCMKMRQTAKREKRLVHRRRQSRGCGRSHRQGKKTGSQSGQLGKCRCCCCCS